MPRILKLLDKYQGQGVVFYVPAVTALLHPDEQRRVVADGHEIGIHGWIHELNSVAMLYEAERDLMCCAPPRCWKRPAWRAAGWASERRPGDFSW